MHCLTEVNIVLMPGMSRTVDMFSLMHTEVCTNKLDLSI